MQALNNSQGFNGLYYPYYRTAFHGDTVVTWGTYLDSTNNSASAWFVYREKNGQYAKVATVPTQSPFPVAVFNNGKWMGGQSSAEPVIELFRLDANDNVVNFTTIQQTSMQYTTLLSDDTIVFLDQTNNFTSLVLQSNGSWIPLPKKLAALSFLGSSSEDKVVHISDDFLVFFNVSQNVRCLIHARQPDGSWLLNDTFVFAPPVIQVLSSFSIYYNGYDSLIVVYSHSTFNNTPTPGFIVFTTKVNNEWKYQIITGYEVGLANTQLNLGIGGGIAAIDANTVVINAPVQGVANEALGNLLVVRRTNNTWNALATAHTPDFGSFGTAVGVTNNHVVATLATYANSVVSYHFYSVPRCLFAPINATCFDVEVSTCQFDVSNTDAFEINQCGGYDVKASVSGLAYKNNSLAVTFEFDRVLSPTVTCSSTLACPVPPSAVPATTVTPGTNTVSSASVISSVASLALVLALF